MVGLAPGSLCMHRLTRPRNTPSLQAPLVRYAFEVWKLSNAHFAKKSTKAVDINLTTIKHNLRKSILSRKYLFGTLFSVILRPRVLVQPRESNPRPSALQSSALPTELILPRLVNIQRGLVFITCVADVI